MADERRRARRDREDHVALLQPGDLVDDFRFERGLDALQMSHESLSDLTYDVLYVFQALLGPRSERLEWGRQLARGA